MSEHGTNAKYVWHLRHGETPCQPCRDAHTLRYRGTNKLAPSVRPGRFCERCDTPIPRNREKFCSAECMKVKDRSPVWPRNCAHCRKPFIARRPRTVTCGPGCSEARHKQRANKSTPRTRNKQHVRRALEKYSDITAAQEAAMRRKARKCPLCRVSMTDKPLVPNSKHLDHIMPINQGGTHTHGNVRIICADCNLRRPKDGSDYAGPVTLWAMAPGVVIPPKAAPKPKPAPKGRPVARCRCGSEYALMSHRQRLCRPCIEMAGRQAATLRNEGWKWEDIATELAYPSVGSLHTLAHRFGQVVTRYARAS